MRSIDIPQIGNTGLRLYNNADVLGEDSGDCWLVEVVGQSLGKMWSSRSFWKETQWKEGGGESDLFKKGWRRWSFFTLSGPVSSCCYST